MANACSDRYRLPMRGRYLTEDLTGVGGQIKILPEDFVVEELPLYEPCGRGDHTYLHIQKRGLSTLRPYRPSRESWVFQRAALAPRGSRTRRPWPARPSH